MIPKKSGFLYIYKDGPKGKLRHGDIFRKDTLKKITSEEEGDMSFLDIELFLGWILLSADCAVIKKGRTNFFVFAGIFDFIWFLEEIDNSKSYVGYLISQKLNDYYFLNPDPFFAPNGAVVEFGFLESIPSSIENGVNDDRFDKVYDLLLSNRIKSLRTDWRTNFALRVANYFGRIGTPNQDFDRIKNWRDKMIIDYS